VASRPYSTRFLKISVGGAWVYYTVPAGHRAVVKSIAASNGTTTAGTVWVDVAGVPCYAWPAPGAISFNTAALAQVAYAGEKIGGIAPPGAWYLLVSGYLLLDDGSFDDGHDDLDYVPLFRPEQLPRYLADERAAG